MKALTPLVLLAILLLTGCDDARTANVDAITRSGPDPGGGQAPMGRPSGTN